MERGERCRWWISGEQFQHQFDSVQPNLIGPAIVVCVAEHSIGSSCSFPIPTVAVDEHRSGYDSLYMSYIAYALRNQRAGNSVLPYEHAHVR